mmetsp:Transcript_1430/g.4211  ORF Transcript_1430/g.4211 Transcript_1430/m.4211 type:complete len:220 (+) Transcript_1430:131-790(+)
MPLQFHAPLLQPVGKLRRSLPQCLRKRREGPGRSGGGACHSLADEELPEGLLRPGAAAPAQRRQQPAAEPRERVGEGLELRMQLQALRTLARHWRVRGDAVREVRTQELGVGARHKQEAKPHNPWEDHKELCVARGTRIRKIWCKGLRGLHLRRGPAEALEHARPQHVEPAQLPALLPGLQPRHESRDLGEVRADSAGRAASLPDALAQGFEGVHDAAC